MRISPHVVTPIRALWKAAKGIFVASAIYGAGSGVYSYSQSRSTPVAVSSAVSEVDLATAWAVRTFFRGMPRNDSVANVASWVTFPITGIAGVGAGTGAFVTNGGAQIAERTVAYAKSNSSHTYAARP